MSTPLRALAGLGLGLLMFPASARPQVRAEKAFRVRVGPTFGIGSALLGRTAIYPASDGIVYRYQLRFPDSSSRAGVAVGGLLDAGTELASLQLQLEYRSYAAEATVVDPVPPPANGPFTYYETNEAAAGAPASGVAAIRFEVRPLTVGPVRLSAAVGAERLLSRRKTAGLAAVGFRLPSGAGVFFFETSLERYHVNYSRVNLVFQNGSIASETVDNRSTAINAGSIRLGFLVGRP